MNTNLREIFSSIPDFDEFMKLVDEIGFLSFNKMSLEKDIKTAEANVVRECITSDKYFQGGKPPSMSYIESTYKYTGLNNEILPLRERYADLSAQLDKRKLQLSVYRDMLEVWRTLSANERSTSLQ